MVHIRKNKNSLKRSSFIAIKITCLIHAIVMMAIWAMPVAAEEDAIVKVNGTVLTRNDLEEMMQKIIPASRFHGRVSEETKEEYRPKAVQMLIEDELLFQEARKRGMKVKRAMVKDAKKATIKRLNGEKNFKAALKQAGLSEKEYEEKLERRFLIDKIINEEITEKAKVTDKEIKAFYDENKKTFMRPEARRIRHILVKLEPSASKEEWKEKKNRAEEALEKLKGGADFSEVAWDYSEDPYRVKGGDLGLIHLGRLSPGLEEEVWKLEKGELSGIIKTIYGYHIVRVDDVTERVQMKLEDVRKGIRKKLNEEKTKELKEHLLTRLREESTIEAY